MLSLERQNELREAYRRANPGWRPATEVYAATAKHFLQPDSRVLDLGCGRGGLVEQLKHPLSKIVGLDPDLASLQSHRLAAQRPSLPRIAGHSRQLPFSDGSFDLVLASWVFEHLAQPEPDFRQIGRVLRPNGVLLFITPNRRHPLSGFNRLGSRFASIQDQLVERFYHRASADTFPAYYRANCKAKLHNLAQVARMKLVNLEAIADPTYLAFNPAMYRVSSWLEGRLPAGRRIHLVGWMRRADGP